MLSCDAELARQVYYSAISSGNPSGSFLQSFSHFYFVSYLRMLILNLWHIFEYYSYFCVIFWNAICPCIVVTYFQILNMNYDWFVFCLLVVLRCKDVYISLFSGMFYLYRSAHSFQYVKSGLVVFFFFFFFRKNRKTRFFSSKLEKTMVSSVFIVFSWFFQGFNWFYYVSHIYKSIIEQ